MSVIITSEQVSDLVPRTEFLAWASFALWHNHWWPNANPYTFELMLYNGRICQYVMAVDHGPIGPMADPMISHYPAAGFPPVPHPAPLVVGAVDLFYGGTYELLPSKLGYANVQYEGR